MKIMMDLKKPVVAVGDPGILAGGVIVPMMLFILVWIK